MISYSEGIKYHCYYLTHLPVPMTCRSEIGSCLESLRLAGVELVVASLMSTSTTCVASEAVTQPSALSIRQYHGSRDQVR
jgi:hypothetical protein